MGPYGKDHQALHGRRLTAESLTAEQPAMMHFALLFHAKNE